MSFMAVWRWRLLTVLVPGAVSVLVTRSMWPWKSHRTSDSLHGHTHRGIHKDTARLSICLVAALTCGGSYLRTLPYSRKSMSRPRNTPLTKPARR